MGCSYSPRGHRAGTQVMLQHGLHLDNTALITLNREWAPKNAWLLLLLSAPAQQRDPGVQEPAGSWTTSG